MKMFNKKWKNILAITAIIMTLVSAGGYMFLEHLKTELIAKIKGCELKSQNFNTIIDFEYVNNWIVVQAQVGESDKLFPFIFDTGAQTVILDSLMKEITPANYDNISFTKKTETAFNNELLTLNSLQLGDVKFSGIGAITADNEKWGMLNCISAYGIIGCNMIKTCGFQIDYKKQQITITDHVEDLPNYHDITWISYQPSSLQESPIIAATINDSIYLNLLFDTGMSGFIKLSSTRLYNAFSQNSNKRAAKYTYIPSIRIRGESSEPINALKYNASILSIGGNISKDVKINIVDHPEREYMGIIGNKYFEDYIITLDYKNRRIGFIPQAMEKNENGSYGFGYLPFGNKMIVTSLFTAKDPEKAGVELGDELLSINGILISELESNKFCETYRQEYSFTNPQDTIMQIKIRKADSVKTYRINKYIMFQ